jgi:hypothetical protein
MSAFQCCGRPFAIEVATSTLTVLRCHRCRKTRTMVARWINRGGGINGVDKTSEAPKAWDRWRIKR